LKGALVPSAKIHFAVPPATGADKLTSYASFDRGIDSQRFRQCPDWCTEVDHFSFTHESTSSLAARRANGLCLFLVLFQPGIGRTFYGLTARGGGLTDV
jgi:hypothetical protein